jgi:predicted amidophosphoribosyltransferase
MQFLSESEGYVCPCCRNDVDELVRLQGRGNPAPKAVCEACWRDAMAGDRRVWAWYWHETPAHLEHPEP